MKDIGKLCLIVPVFFLSSCLINRQRQVWLGALQQTHQADTGSVVRIYFDKQGSVYPDKKLFIPYKKFFDPVNGKITITENKNNGSLQSFYTTNRLQLKQLSSFYGIEGTGIISSRDSFFAVQHLIKKQIADSLNKLFGGSILRTLVVLIHGFNDSDPTGDYQLTREAIRNNGLEKGRFIYLEIYWDGLTLNQGNPIYENIWGRALQNSAYVSMGLRQILSGIDPLINIRIITHSLGASVGTGAIFNTVTKWSKNGLKKIGKKLEKDYGLNYYDEQKNFKTPLNNIRIGMIAPAIPGSNTFIDFNKRNPVIPNSENNIQKIVVGFNVNDLAVTKRTFNIDFAPFFGSTSLGCNCLRKGKPEIERTEEALSKNEYSTEMIKKLLRPVDFSRYERKKSYEEHGLYYYLQNTEKVKEFMNELFE